MLEGAPANFVMSSRCLPDDRTLREAVCHLEGNVLMKTGHTSSIFHRWTTDTKDSIERVCRNVDVLPVFIIISPVFKIRLRRAPFKVSGVKV